MRYPVGRRMHTLTPRLAEATARSRAVLVDAAAHREVVTYGELSELIGGLVLPRTAQAREVEEARISLARVGVALTPRKQWPVGMDRLGLPALRGRITESERAATGMAVGRMDGLGVAGALRRRRGSRRAARPGPPGGRPPRGSRHELRGRR